MDMNKFRASASIFFLVIFFNSMKAQEPENNKRTRPKNNVSLNVLGDVTLISGNYERIIPIAPQIMIIGKIGLGYNENILRWLDKFIPANRYFTISGHLTANFGKERLFLEFGAGNTYLTRDGRNINVIYPVIGFRMLPTEPDRISFRIFFYLPRTVLGISEFTATPLGFNFGYSF